MGLNCGNEEGWKVQCAGLRTRAIAHSPDAMRVPRVARTPRDALSYRILLILPKLLFRGLFANFGTNCSKSTFSQISSLANLLRNVNSHQVPLLCG